MSLLAYATGPTPQVGASRGLLFNKVLQIQKEVMRTVMTVHDRDRFSRLLQEKEESLVDLLRQRDTITIEKAADEVDALQLAQGREVAIETLDRIYSLLQSVRAARERLADGSFGICLRCEETISLKRLNAVPWAAYCVACQSIVDQETRRGMTDGIPAVEPTDEA